MNRRQLIRLASASALALLASCASYKTSRPVEIDRVPESWDRLPYHVAIIPIDPADAKLVADVGGKSGAPFLFDDIYEQSNGDGSDVLTQKLEGALSANSFRKVTVLPAPSPELRAKLGEEYLPSYWVAAAREARADLLLDIESFRYPKYPRSSAKLTSYLLYLFGPVEILYPDREYSFEGVELAVSLYDIAALDDAQIQEPADLVQAMNEAEEGNDKFSKELVEAARLFQLGVGGGLVREFRLTPRDLSYRYGDRLGKSPATVSFLPALIIPSAWLAKGSPRFSERLTNDASLALAQDLARDIVDTDYKYIVEPKGRRPDGLHFDARNATIARSEDVPGALEIRARMRPPTKTIENPEVWIAGRSFKLLFRDAPAQQRRQLVQQTFRADDRAAIAFTDDIESNEGFTQRLVVYVPDPTMISGPMHASYSDKTPIDVVQLRMDESLNAVDSRTRSWTFDLEDVLEEEAVEELRSTRPAAFGTTSARLDRPSESSPSPVAAAVED